MTGVVGWEGGEQFGVTPGVTRSSLLGDKLLVWPGEVGGWSGRGVVGVMPGMLTDLDINWVCGWEKFSNVAQNSSFPGSVQQNK